VSEIPVGLQAKLLRVLQEREFERVGGNRTMKVNVRIIATSNRDLLSYVEKGDFRQDLYYRLNVFPVIVPPLRERAEDILMLADHFVRRFVRKHGIKVTGLSDSARAAVQSYRWPGNVRELQNTIERAVIMSEPGRALTAASLGLPADLNFSETLAVAEELPPEPSRGDGLTAANGEIFKLDQLEKQAIQAALRQTAGNRTKAADALGISIRTLRNKLQEYRDAGEPIGADSGQDA
jgi:DNA-binding NtrC family response regulator